MKTPVILVMAMALACGGAWAAPADPTAAALDRCLDDPAHYSTAGQTDCEAQAARDYDRRMNAAYKKLMDKLPREAGERLRASQRSWLAFRDGEMAARQAIYATRQGTMYVPMQASSAADFVRDRALQLEGYVGVMDIDGSGSYGDRP